MARQSITSTLHAFMNGRKVGVLVQRPNGAMDFTYDIDWLAWPDTRPISLSLPLTSSIITGSAVINYFDNLLPDNSQIRARIQTQFGTATTRPFDLLAQIGGDCVGALQLSPDEAPPNIKTINGTPVSDNDIARRLKSYIQTPLGMHENEDFRISIAGAQEKTAFLWHNNKWKVPLGATPTTHIFKLPIGKIAGHDLDLTTSCENEWLCMKIAETFGLPTAPVQLRQFEDQTVLIVERFDRRKLNEDKWILRLPQEDMCQVLGIASGLKYESDGGPGIASIMDILRYSENAHTDREVFMRTMIVFWLLAAIDGHGKNFSVFIKPEGCYSLTPLYDIMSAYPLVGAGEWQPHKLKMGMAALGKNKHYTWREILPRHWITTAEKVKFSPERMQEIMNESFDGVEEVIQGVSAQLPVGFPSSVSETIFEGMRSVRDRFHSV